MSDRRKVLELFDIQKDFMDNTVLSNIEKYRKGDVKIVLMDKDGKLIQDAKVVVKQTSHEFRFGANLLMLDEFESDEKNVKYRKYFSDVFNIATLPFYWDSLEPERYNPRYSKDSVKVYRRPAPDLCIEFCEEHGIEPREHGLAYEAFFPKWLYDAPLDEIKFELERRYKEISDRYADKIPTTEVTNEMVWEKGKTVFYDQNDYVEWCFKLAEKYFPNNQLCINEHTSSCWKERGRSTDNYFAYIEANMLKGARIDAIGMQFHMFNINKGISEYDYTRKTYNPEILYKNMDLYSSLNKPLQITEVTIPAYSNDSIDEEIQADIIEKLYTVWFSHPSVEQIIYWNLVDGYAHLWDPDPEKIKASQGDMTIGENVYYGGLLRFDLSPKPAYYKLKDLIYNKWNTSLSLKTDNIGEASFRGFYGKYDVEIIVGNNSYVKKIDVLKNKDNKIIIKI